MSIASNSNLFNTIHDYDSFIKHMKLKYTYTIPNSMSIEDDAYNLIGALNSGYYILNLQDKMIKSDDLKVLKDGYFTITRKQLVHQYLQNQWHIAEYNKVTHEVVLQNVIGERVITNPLVIALCDSHYRVRQKKYWGCYIQNVSLIKDDLSAILNAKYSFKREDRIVSTVFDAYINTLFYDILDEDWGCSTINSVGAAELDGGYSYYQHKWCRKLDQRPSVYFAITRYGIFIYWSTPETFKYTKSISGLINFIITMSIKMSDTEEVVKRVKDFKRNEYKRLKEDLEGACSNVLNNINSNT